MATITAKAALFGTPASSLNEADRALLLTYLQQLETNATAGGAMWPFDSKSELVASAGVDGDTGLILNDGTASNNGFYVRSSGTWAKTADLPPLWQSPIPLTGTAGSGSAYTASGFVGSDIDGGWVLFTPHATNAIGNPTLSINGGTARGIRTAVGAIDINRLVPGVPVLMYRDATLWRIHEDGVAPGIHELTATAGTSAAYTATGDIGVDTANRWAFFTPHVTNTVGTPSLTINGGTARNIQTATGALDVGLFVPGVPVLLYRSGTVWRIHGDTFSPGITVLAGVAGTSAAYTATGDIGVDSDQRWVLFTPHVTNTVGTPTLSINGGTARAIGRKNGALGNNRFVADVPVIMYRDGSVWRTTNSIDANLVNLGTLTTTNGLAYTGSAGNSSLRNGESVVRFGVDWANGGDCNISIDGGLATQLLDDDGQALSAGMLRPGGSYTAWYNGSNFLVHGLRADNLAETDELAQAQALRASMSRTPLYEGGNEDSTIGVTGTYATHHVASAGDYDAIIDLGGVGPPTRYVDARFIKAGRSQPISISVRSGGTIGKLITPTAIYTLSSGAFVNYVRDANDADIIQVIEGTVTQEADALDPIPASDISFATGGQSLAQRFLDGGGMHGLQRGMRYYNQDAPGVLPYPSIYPIQGAVGASGLVPASAGSGGYWWEPGVGPGPLAIAWRDAVAAAVAAGQPQISFIYWVFGNNDAGFMGTDPALDVVSYKFYYQALFQWMRDRADVPDDVPIIISPLGAQDNAFANNGNMPSAVRWVEDWLIDNVANCYRGPELYDLPRPYFDVHLETQGQIIQGFRLAGILENVLYGAANANGPFVAGIEELDGGRRYRLRISDGTTADRFTRPNLISNVAVLAAGEDPLTQTAPEEIVDTYWEVVSGDWFYNVVLSQPAPGGTVMYPWGYHWEVNSRRFPVMQKNAPVNLGWSNHPPLQGFASGAF